MIKVFRFSTVSFIFEVLREEYRENCPLLALVGVTQAQFIPVPGSICQILSTEITVWDGNNDLWFPKDKCRDANSDELLAYNNMPTV